MHLPKVGLRPSYRYNRLNLFRRGEVSINKFEYPYENKYQVRQVIKVNSYRAIPFLPILGPLILAPNSTQKFSLEKAIDRSIELHFNYKLQFTEASSMSPSTKLQVFAALCLILLFLPLYNIMSVSTSSMQRNNVSKKKVSVHMLNAEIMRLDSYTM